MTTTDQIAEAIRKHFGTMSGTDQAMIRKAIIRSERKALAEQMRELSAKGREPIN